MERLERNVRDLQLFAFLDQDGPSEYQLGKLGAFEVGNTVTYKDTFVFIRREAADNSRFAHTALDEAMLIAGMRPFDADRIAVEAAAVAINPVWINRVG